MQVVINEYLKQDSGYTVLRITGVTVVDVLVDNHVVEKLRTLTWCYDQNKRDVYATDSTMTIPEQLGVSSPRVFLWKYILFVNSNVIAKAWRGRARNDYRIGYGQVITESVYSP